MSPDLKKLYFETLDRFTLMTVASADHRGNPHASPVLFVHDELGNLYFGALPGTRKVQNMRENKHISLAMADAKGKYGVQLSGVADEVAEPRCWQVRDQLRKRHPDSDDFYASPEVVYFRVQPEDLYVLNFSWGIDFRKRVELQGGSASPGQSTNWAAK